MSKRFRNVCFTSFSDDIPEYDRDVMTYMVFQQELSPETKRLHWQGYVEFSKQVGLKYIKEALGECHIEPRRGTAKQAAEYCKKQESRVQGPFEHGTISSPGRRSDMEEIHQMVKEHKSIREIYDSFPSQAVRYGRGIRDLQAVLHPPVVRPRPQIYILVGPPGSGKSRWAATNFPDAYWAKDTPQAWFDGYDGQDTVIFDEFDANIPRTVMLQILDYVPLRMPIKGGYVTLNANKFVFTSNRPVDQWYWNCPAFQRRIREFKVEVTWDSITQVTSEHNL